MRHPASARRNCAAHTRRLACPAVIEYLQSFGHHRGGIDAGASICRRQASGGPRVSPTIWGYNSIGFFAPDARYSSSGVLGRAGGRIQKPGQDASSRGHRGHPRRGLQSHWRRQSAGADAVFPRHRQRVVLSSGGKRPPLLHGLHRLRQHARMHPSAVLQFDHGQLALLDHGDARRRFSF